MDIHLRKYKALREKIDAKVNALEHKHKKHMLCKAGCSMCCREYAILPVEFNAIKEEISARSHTSINPITGNDECPFLVNHRCSIYEHRPIICRTHGLPLLFMGEENWELSACELNFTKVAEDYFNFENTFPQDTFNSELYLLNEEYLKSKKQGLSDDQRLISIKELAKR